METQIKTSTNRPLSFQKFATKVIIWDKVSDVLSRGFEIKFVDTRTANYEYTEQEALALAKQITVANNMHVEAMDTLLALVRESKSNTEAVKKAVELLNRNKE